MVVAVAGLSGWKHKPTQDGGRNTSKTVVVARGGCEGRCALTLARVRRNERTTKGDEDVAYTRQTPTQEEGKERRKGEG